MRPGEFWEAMDAYEHKVRADRQHIGELVRGATLRLWNLQVAERHRTADPVKFWAMPWDDPDREGKEIKRLKDLSEAEKQVEVEKFLKRVHHGKRTESEG